MRTLALAIAVTACFVLPPAAEAVCTSGIDCIRERFGTDSTLRNNRIIDRTDRLGDRRTPVNPYAARQGRRAAQSAPTYDPAPDPQARLPGARTEVEPGVWYTPGITPGTPMDPSLPGAPGAPGGLQDQATAPTVEPYAPAEPVQGGARQAGTATAEPGSAASRDPYAALRPTPARRAPPNPNRPAAAADLRYSSPGSSGARR